MAYSDNFPAVRPVFQADFANGGKIDPRATFSRSDTPPTYAAPSAVHYMSNEKHLSSENLLLQSSDFDTTWGPQGLTSITGGQADPSGGTGGFTLLENTATIFHRITQSLTVTGELAFTVYAKRTSGTRYLNLTIAESGAQHSAGLATFDLAGGATHTANGSSSGLTNLSATQTASGNGYYKCVFYATATTTVRVDISFSDVATPASNNYGLVSYTGDGTSSIDVAFASLSTVGATDYNATTTSIHRQYASTLKSVSTAGQPRFEYGIDGQSMGVLVESQATNLVTYSEDFSSWAATRSQVESSVAVGPDGTLSADRFVEDASEGGSNSHYMQSNFTTTNSTQYTMSVYAKHGGGANRYCQLRVMGVGSGFAFANFDLSNGTYVGGGGSIRDSYSISSVGNGWHRLTMTFTNNSSGGTVNGMGIVLAAANSEMHQYTSDDYSGFLLYGAQCETGSFGSSLVGTSGASATRASDSLSMTDANLFDNGEGTIVAEYDTNNPSAVAGIAAVTDGTGSSNAVSLRLQASTAKLFVNDAGSTQAATSTTAPSAGVFQKIAGRYAANNFGVSVNGGSVVSDTSGTVPVVSKLEIGTMDNGSYHLNGHVKRVAIYPALSDTNLQSLTAS